MTTAGHPMWFEKIERSTLRWAGVALAAASAIGSPGFQSSALAACESEALRKHYAVVEGKAGIYQPGMPAQGGSGNGDINRVCLTHVDSIWPERLSRSLHSGRGASRRCIWYDPDNGGETRALYAAIPNVLTLDISTSTGADSQPILRWWMLKYRQSG